MKKIDWGSTKRKAAEWKEFQEGATVGDGNPKIICSRCSLVLTHPSLGSGNNCMTMLKHQAIDHETEVGQIRSIHVIEGYYLCGLSTCFYSSHTAVML